MIQHCITQWKHDRNVLLDTVLYFTQWKHCRNMLLDTLLCVTQEKHDVLRRWAKGTACEDPEGKTGARSGVARLRKSERLLEHESQVKATPCKAL